VEGTAISAHSALNTNLGAYLASQDVVLRDCTITATDGDDEAKGIYLSGLGVSLEAIGLTVTASGGDTTYALHTREDVVLRGGSYTASGGATSYGIRVDDSLATVEAYGVQVSGRSAALNSYGVFVDEGGLHAHGSQLAGDTAAIYTASGFMSGASYLGVTMLDGAVSGSGSYYCFDVYDASMAGVACP
jgi:hypothetical protein